MKLSIWKSTYRLLTEQKTPFSKLSIRAICEACAIHHTSFYYHFNDKFDLFNFGIQQLLADYERLSIQTKFTSPFSVSNTFFKNSDLQLLITAQTHDPLAPSLITRYAEKQLVTEAFLYLENKTISVPQQLLAQQLVRTIFTISDWSQTQAHISDTELDVLYQELTANLFI